MVITYGYARVSTKEQVLDRQFTSIRGYCPSIPEGNIFSDKETGKIFERTHYSEMKIILEHVAKTKSENDVIELVVEELDRLGRNAEGIKQELQWFKEHGIMVRILEIPTTLLEVKSENKWVMELINQIIIEVYSAMAEQELEKRAKRQREGIDAALAKGIKFGRPSIEINDIAFENVYKDWKTGKITAVEAMKRLGVKTNTFYRRVAKYEGRVGKLNENNKTEL